MAFGSRGNKNGTNDRVMSIDGLLLAGRGLDQHSLKLYNIRCSECFNMISDRTHVRHCLLYEFQLGHTCGDAFRNLSVVFGPNTPSIFNLIKRWRYVIDNDGDYCPDKFEV